MIHYKNIFLSAVILGTALFLTACGNSKSSEKKSDVKVNTKMEEKIELKFYNADFYAEDKDADWSLAVGFKGELTFLDKKNNIQFQSETNHVEVAKGANVVNVFSENKSMLIQVTIDVVDCEESGKHVNIMLRHNTDKKELDYSGCGFYRGAPQLHDIWALYKLNGTEITPDQFPKELPHFEFDLVNKTISGFAGCNQINGKLAFDYNQIIVEPLISTRMYCHDLSKIEDNILKILKNKPFYRIKDLHLYIENSEGSIVLKKID